MSEVGRNDPCPCGSGRKAKNCCHRAEVPAAKVGSVVLPAMGGAPARKVPNAEAVLVALELQKRRELPLAEQIYAQVLAADPDQSDAMLFLGVLRHQVGRSAEGVELMRKAVKLKPNNRLYLYNLAKVSEELGHLSESIDLYQRSLKIEPSPDACNNLGSLLLGQGRVEEAIACYKRGNALDPSDIWQQSNLLYAMNFTADPDLQSIFEEHRKFGERYERSIAGAAPQIAESDRGANRPLRIGYVSADFRQHSVAHFIEPVLAAHDKTKFEVFAYYNQFVGDEITQRIERQVANWRTIASFSDEKLAGLIRADAIDILVDLSGHTPLHRLRTFALKPAPVQATWLGYPNTTGLRSMDYRITDAFADPVGMTEALHTEKLIRLPESFSCFLPPETSPPVGPLPALKSGSVTFGSFNNFAKITPQVIETWANILLRLPTARLVLKYRGVGEPAMQAMAHQVFARHGVSAERVQMLDKDASQMAHMERYNSIDIGLDPFPYNGSTTTCDALWMGVPVVTLAGRSHVARVGVSQMSNLGLLELIARDRDHYVELAVGLAGDLERLKSLRAGLRERMKASSLMNPERLTRHLERAYQEMWTKR
ncbi:MAG: tetratricopeptide repeat protein [Planctomycetes bacterium]|nr:tetratricopeptide repeat protein [Planctomycetota bacterium]